MLSGLGGLLGVVVALLGGVSSTIGGVTGSPSGSSTTTTPTIGNQTTCAWVARISGDQLNVAFPDAAANYWIADVPLPPGGRIEMTGDFPHARYMSVIDYTAASQAIDGLADYQIAPERGSTNPFVVGANRNAARRAYTLHVVSGSVPSSGRARNTIYTTNGTKVSPPGSVVIIYRVYEPDRGLDITGGVGLPGFEVVSATGQSVSLTGCQSDSLPDLGVTERLANAGASGASPLPNTGLGSRNPPVWVRYTNPASGVVTGALDNELTGTNLYPFLYTLTNTLPSGGFFENIDNAYVTSFDSAGFGPVLAFRAKAPTTPQTYDGEARMGRGQLRFWSFCTANAATMYYACVRDDQVPRDRRGYYTVVISTAANRPSNARAACGYTWLPAGPAPQTVLILRNMLPAPGFKHAIQDVTAGVNERQVMGPYYPQGRYYSSVAEFEQRGCR